ncbi:MAG: hypothetical protein ACI8Z1_001270 [Candidatus Azotimanducaceae bacterium]|jgi:hypothetical protein
MKKIGFITGSAIRIGIGGAESGDAEGTKAIYFWTAAAVPQPL